VRQLEALRVPRAAPDEERARAAHLLTRVRDWSATALGRGGVSLPMLPAEEELETGIAEASLQSVVESAVATARNGVEAGALLGVGKCAGSTLGAWGRAGLGDLVHEAEETVRSAAGPAH
jgi:hypothetical protein